MGIANFEVGAETRKNPLRTDRCKKILTPIDTSLSRSLKGDSDHLFFRLKRAKAAMTALVFRDAFDQIAAAEVRPEFLEDHDFGIADLP